MDTIRLGRTGLMVTVLGLGSGGFSRLGKGQGKDDENAFSVVRRALELGVNFLDTAEAYGTEHLIGKEIVAAGRNRMVLSTKLTYREQDRIKTPAEIEKSLEESLRRLRTDWIDVYHVHGVQATDYETVVNQVYPVLSRQREKGKIRFIGITEAFHGDTAHRMLSRAVEDDIWDVFMTGFNMLNQSARSTVLKQAIERDIGVLCMFAVRKALTSREALREYLRQMIADGHIHGEEVDLSSPLEFLLKPGVSDSLTEAAYRYCRYEPGIHTVLSGTGSVQHMEENVRAIQGPPLPEAAVLRLREIFGKVDSISGQ